MSRVHLFLVVIFFLMSNIFLFAYKVDPFAASRKIANIVLDSEVAFIAEFSGKTELIEIKRTKEEIQKNKILIEEYKKRLEEIEGKLSSKIHEYVKRQLRSEKALLENKIKLYAVEIYYVYRAFATVVHRYKGDVEDKVIIELRVSPTKENLIYEKLFRTDLKEGEKCYALTACNPINRLGEIVYGAESYLYISYSDRLESVVENSEITFFRRFDTISFLVKNIETLNEFGCRQLDYYNIFKGADKKEIPAIWEKNMAKFKFEKNKFDLNEERRKNYEESYLKK